MIKDRNEMNRRITVDLQSSQGNAFYLLGLAGDLGKKIGLSKAEVKSIQDNMTLSDYTMLVEIFDKHFGDYVDIYK
jgi:GTPase